MPVATVNEASKVPLSTAFTCFSSCLELTYTLCCFYHLGHGHQTLSVSFAHSSFSIAHDRLKLSFYESCSIFPLNLFSIFLTPPLASPLLLRLFWSPVA